MLLTMVVLVFLESTLKMQGLQVMLFNPSFYTRGNKFNENVKMHLSISQFLSIKFRTEKFQLKGRHWEDFSSSKIKKDTIHIVLSLILPPFLCLPSSLPPSLLFSIPFYYLAESEHVTPKAESTGLRKVQRLLLFLLPCLVFKSAEISSSSFC